jgi:cold-inducible RNA-binding protein
MAKRLFIGNLPYSATSAQLEELFSQVGKVASLNLITDKFSGQSKGFAFVDMETDEESDEAIKKFNNYELDGRKIVVNVAKPREERNRFDQNRGNYSRPGGNRW